KEINGYYTLPPAAAAAVVGALAGAGDPASAAAAAASAGSGLSRVPKFDSSNAYEEYMREMLTGEGRWQGHTLKEAVPLTSFTELKDDGSTACGAWVYTGIYAPSPDHPMGYNHAANRQGDNWV